MASRTLKLKVQAVNPPIDKNVITKSLEEVAGVSGLNIDTKSGIIEIETGGGDFSATEAIYQIGECGDYIIKVENGRVFGVGDMGCSGCSSMVDKYFRKVAKEVTVDLERKMAVMECIEKDGKEIGEVVGEVKKKGKRVMEWNGGNGVVLEIKKNNGLVDEWKVKRLLEEIKNVEKCKIVERNDDKGESKTVLTCKGIFDMETVKNVMENAGCKVGLYAALANLDV